MLHIATISNSEDITKLDFSPYTFSVVPNTYMMAKGLVRGVSATWPGKKDGKPMPPSLPITPGGDPARTSRLNS